MWKSSLDESYAGQAAGHGLTHVMFGLYNPGGRLPITYYPASYVDTVPESDMQMRPSATSSGRTYKFYRGEAVFEFGYGLSYTTLNYSWNNQTMNTSVAIESLIGSDEKKFHLHLYRVNVTNTGDMAGSDVVLAFIVPPQQSSYDSSPPLKKLFDFQRVYLEVNQTTELYFPLNIRSLLTTGEDGLKWLEPGLYHILLGKRRMYNVELQGKALQWI